MRDARDPGDDGVNPGCHRTWRAVPRQDGHRVCRHLDRNAGGGMAALARPALTAAAVTKAVELNCSARRERLDDPLQEELDNRRGLLVAQPDLLRHLRDERGCGQRFPAPIGLPHHRAFHTAFYQVPPSHAR
jgi:hypothetical protein